MFYLNHKIRQWQSPFLTANILFVFQGLLFVFSVSEKLFFWVYAEAWLGPKGAAACLAHAQAWTGFRNGVPWQMSQEEHRQKTFSWTWCRCFPLLPRLFFFKTMGEEVTIFFFNSFFLIKGCERHRFSSPCNLHTYLGSRLHTKTLAWLAGKLLPKAAALLGRSESLSGFRG